MFGSWCLVANAENLRKATIILRVYVGKVLYCTLVFKYNDLKSLRTIIVRVTHRESTTRELKGRGRHFFTQIEPN